MSSELISFFEKASAEEALTHDPKYFRAMAGIVPKNSGIQNIYKDYHHSMLVASNMHWKWRNDAIKMIKAVEYGIAAIASEGGAGLKSITTTRQEMVMQSQNNGPKPDLWDKVFYGKEKFDNQ
tara:strand:+ start:7287 stop:7655 length:369 start_codon:yes stop_codon:yes gene_type:complete